MYSVEVCPAKWRLNISMFGLCERCCWVFPLSYAYVETHAVHNSFKHTMFIHYSFLMESQKSLLCSVQISSLIKETAMLIMTAHSPFVDQ